MGMLRGMAKRSLNRPGEQSTEEGRPSGGFQKQYFLGEKNETNRLSDKLDHFETFISSDGKSDDELVIGVMF